MSKLHYIRKGTGQNKILLIHGNVASAKWWGPVMDRLQNRFDCLAVDLRGYGASEDGTKDVTISLHAQDIMETLEDMKFFPCVVVGHSLGGAVAMEMGKLYPEKISKLVLLDSAQLEGLGDYDCSALEPIVADPNLLKMALKATFFQPIPVQLEAVLMEDCVRAKDAFIPNTKALMKTNYTQDAPKFTKPVLVIRGENDKVIPLAEAEKIVAAYPNSAMISIPNCGHNPPLEATEQFSKILAEFVEK